MAKNFSITLTDTQGKELLLGVKARLGTLDKLFKQATKADAPEAMEKVNQKIGLMRELEREIKTAME